MDEKWPSKDPEEQFAVSFDFSSELSSVTSATVTVRDSNGNDAAKAILNESPQITGAVVRQRVKDGAHMAEYKFRCVGSDGVETYVITQILPVARK